MTEKILNFNVSTSNKDCCLKIIHDWILQGSRPHYFICANPHSLMVAETDPTFKEAIHSADLITPDGVGMIIASKMLGGKICQRITGSDVFQSLSQRLNDREGHSFSYFFLGSTDETLQKIKQQLLKDYPNICFAGSYSPPYKAEFSEDDNQAMVEAINVVRPDVLWVGMTAPKQEKWIFQNKNKLDVKFIGAIGAVFDFYVGNVKRSHPIFLKLGLEWLPRLLQEPRRLWRRNFISNPKFVFKVIMQRLHR